MQNYKTLLSHWWLKFYHELPSNLVLFTKGKIIEIVNEMSDRLCSTERKEVL